MSFFEARMKAKYTVRGRELRLTGILCGIFFAKLVCFTAIFIAVAAVLFYSRSGSFFPQLKALPGYAVYICSAVGVTAAYFLYVFLTLRREELMCREVYKSRREPGTARDGFFVFLRASVLYFCLILLRLFWTTVFFSPAALIVSAYFIVESLGYMTEGIKAALLITAVVSAAAGAVFEYITLRRYSFLLRPLALGQNIKIKDCFSESLDFTEGECLRFAMYKLSLAAWLPLCLLVFPCLYVVPYVACASYTGLSAINTHRKRFIPHQGRKKTDGAESDTVHWEVPPAAQ